MAEEYVTKPVKSRARRYRERLQEAGYRQVAVWLDSDAYYLLRHFMATHKADAAAVISAVIKHCAIVPSDKLRPHLGVAAIQPKLKRHGPRVGNSGLFQHQRRAVQHRYGQQSRSPRQDAPS